MLDASSLLAVENEAASESWLLLFVANLRIAGGWLGTRPKSRLEAGEEVPFGGPKLRAAGDDGCWLGPGRGLVAAEAVCVAGGVGPPSMRSGLGSGRDREGGLEPGREGGREGALGGGKASGREAGGGILASDRWGAGDGRGDGPPKSGRGAAGLREPSTWSSSRGSNPFSSGTLPPVYLP